MWHPGAPLRRPLVSSSPSQTKGSCSGRDKSPSVIVQQAFSSRESSRAAWGLGLICLLFPRLGAVQEAVVETSTFWQSQRTVHLVWGWAHSLYRHFLLAVLPCSWPPPSRSPLRPLDWWSLPVTAICFSSDTQFIVTGPFQKLILVPFCSCIVPSVSKHESSSLSSHSLYQSSRSPLTTFSIIPTVNYLPSSSRLLCVWHQAKHSACLIYSW